MVCWLPCPLFLSTPEPSACKTHAGNDTMLTLLLLVVTSYRVKSPHAMSPYMPQLCLQKMETLHRAELQQDGC